MHNLNHLSVSLSGRRILVAAALALTLAAAAADAKTFGPNGRIAFDQNEPSGHQFVFTANSNGSDVSQLVPSDSCCPQWSPNSSKLDVPRMTADGRIAPALVNADGSGYTPLPLPDATLNLGPNAWSPDGTRIAFEGWDDPNPARDGVFTGSSTNAGDLVRVTDNPFGGHDIPGDYSPDGTQIAFWRQDPMLMNDMRNGGRYALFVVGVGGGPARQLTGWQGDFGGVSWSPDGQWLLTDNARGQLYVIHPDGTDRHTIHLQVSGGGLTFARVPSWSPDGTKIIFTMFTAQGGLGQRQGQEALYTANADGSDVQSLGIDGLDATWGTHPLLP